MINANYVQVNCPYTKDAWTIAEEVQKAIVKMDAQDFDAFTVRLEYRDAVSRRGYLWLWLVIQQFLEKNYDHLEIVEVNSSTKNEECPDPEVTKHLIPEGLAYDLSLLTMSIRKKELLEFLAGDGD